MQRGPQVGEDGTGGRDNGQTEAPFGVDKFGEKRLITHSWANAMKSIPCISMNVQNVSKCNVPQICKNHQKS